MLSGLALEMYKTDGHMTKVLCTNGNTLVGKCVEFLSSDENWDHEPPEASITLRAPSKNGGAAPGALVEVFQSEIQSVEILEEGAP